MLAEGGEHFHVDVDDAGLPEVILPRRAAPTEPVSANSVMEMSAAGSPELVHRRTGGLVALPTTRPALVSIDVPGIAQTQGSLKPLVRGGKVVVIHDNRRLRPWRDALIWHAREAMADRPPMRGPVGIEVEIRLPRPKSHFGRRGLRPSAPGWPAVRPDSDKLLRAILDGLGEAWVWQDDGQVVRGRFAKRYCRKGESPGVHIELWALEERADELPIAVG